MGIIGAEPKETLYSSEQEMIEEQKAAEEYREENWNNPVMRIKFVYQEAIDKLPLKNIEAVEVFKFFEEKIKSILDDFGEEFKYF